jgi:hypothetical protein
MLSASLKPATVADGAIIAIAGATAARIIIAVIVTATVIVTGTVIVTAIVIVIVAGIVTAEIVIVTDKSRILLNPALAGFFFRRFRQRHAGKAKG